MLWTRARAPYAFLWAEAGLTGDLMAIHCGRSGKLGSRGHLPWNRGDTFRRSFPAIDTTLAKPRSNALYQPVTHFRRRSAAHFCAIAHFNQCPIPGSLWSYHIARAWPGDGWSQITTARERSREVAAASGRGLWQQPLDAAAAVTAFESARVASWSSRCSSRSGQVQQAALPDSISSSGCIPMMKAADLPPASRPKCLNRRKLKSQPPSSPRHPASTTQCQVAGINEGA